MISYYELMLLVKTKKEPYKIKLLIDDKALLFEYNTRYGYILIKNNKENDSYLDLNMYENNFNDKNIEVIEPYYFKRGEYISYFDLLNAIKLNTQPYKVRIHINDMYHDYVYEGNNLNNKNYIEYEVDNSVPAWDFYLSHQVTPNNWFKDNIEVIEAGNSLITIENGTRGGSYFNIYPVKFIDNNISTPLIEMLDCSISIEEDIIDGFLYPLLKKYFNSNLIQNRNRECCNNEFDWYSNNFYEFDTLKDMIKELEKIIYLLKNDYNNKELDYIKENYDWLLYLDPNINTRKSFNLNLVKNYKDEVINFYKRFIEYLNNMINIGEKNGYNLITFVGP